MAGGEGTRLRPVNSSIPKPMVKIMDRPILEHIILLLKRSGISDICLTLRHLPEMITDYFGNGSFLGVNIEYRLERDALGTAGGVKNCSDFIKDDDFLVISGDCVCDFDLRRLMEFHKKQNSIATMALYACREPLEYGSVITGADGRIERFVEKPSWDKVVTDLVNTGIYVLSPEVLEAIPDGKPYDFGKDLFPRLLSENRRLYGLAMTGYWCDVGSCAAYLKCCIDALDGVFELDRGAPEVRRGVFSLSPIPGGTVVIPPVFIGRGVRIESGARIGPCAMIGSGSSVEIGASVRESVTESAAIHKNASVSGAVVCRGASVGPGATVCEGAVIGEDCIIGEHAAVLKNVRLWPERQIPAGARLKYSVTSGLSRERLKFGAGGAIRGEMGVELTPEYCAALGAAAAVWGRIGVGWGGGDASRVLASAMGAGVCAGGAELIEYDGGFRAAAAYTGPGFGIPVTAFFEQNGKDILIYFYSSSGSAISRDMERKLESASDLPRAGAESVGRISRISGVFDSYCAAAARTGRTGLQFHDGITFYSDGRGVENRALKNTLSLMGCSCARHRSDFPAFTAENGGLTLTAIDEDGHSMDWEQLLAITALIEFQSGSGKVAVPFSAPAALELLANDLGTSVLRLGRDGAAADELYSSQPFMRDGIFAAARICAYMSSRRETLSALRSQIPKFCSVSREVPVSCGRGAAMRRLLSECAEFSAELGTGLRFNTGHGWVHVSAAGGRDALCVRAEGPNEELAEEICADITKKIQNLSQNK